MYFQLSLVVTPGSWEKMKSIKREHLTLYQQVVVLLERGPSTPSFLLRPQLIRN